MNIRHGPATLATITAVWLLAGCGDSDEPGVPTTRYAVPVLEERRSGEVVAVGSLRASVALPQGGRFESDEGSSDWTRGFGAGCSVKMRVAVTIDRSSPSPTDLRRLGPPVSSASVRLRSPDGDVRRLPVQTAVGRRRGELLGVAVSWLPAAILAGQLKRTIVVSFSDFDTGSGTCREPEHDAAKEAIEVGLAAVEITVTR